MITKKRVESCLEDLERGSLDSTKELLNLMLNSIPDKPPELWEEFKRAYPSKTPKGRRLYSNLEKTKEKYLKIVENDRMLHKKILTLLDKEKEERYSNSSLEYMSQISKYVNQKLWEAYDEEDGEEGGREFNKFEII